MKDLLDTHFLVNDDIGKLAASVGAVVVHDADDLGEIECFQHETDKVAFEFFRHPGAPNPKAITILSSHPTDIMALAGFLKKLKVKPTDIYTAVTQNARPVGQLRALRQALGYQTTQTLGDQTEQALGQQAVAAPAATKKAGLDTS